MRRVAHLSDLHFGTEDPAVVAGLARDVAEVKADLVVVSGDLTQRAKRKEFAAAASFLRSLPAPFLAVPGNHDIPLYNVARRLWSPFGRYRRLVSPELMPRYSDDELAVIGFNTSLEFVWKGGLVRRAQMAALQGWAAVAGHRLRVVFAHHPFSLPTGRRSHSLVRRSGDAMRVMEEVGVDLVLTGHHHIGGYSESRAFAAGGPHRVVIVSAGTAMSRRVRGDPNSYNLVHVDPGRIAVEERAWNGERFAARHVQTYPRQTEPTGPL
ncbi:MAG: metallophosphoesterase [Thermoplasmatota archaeon]